MRETFSQKLKFGVVGLSSLMLASCGPLISFGDDGPAGDVFTLRYEGAAAKANPTGPVVYVDGPKMAGALDGRNVAVRLDGNRHTALAGAAWSDHLSDMLRDYITLSLAAQSNANMVSEGELDIKAGCRLGTKVWSMEFVPGLTPADDVVEIALQFSLVRLADSHLISHPTFKQTMAVKSSGGRGVVEAFGETMKAVARDYGRWFKEQSPACSG